jgi:hypothetical protein
VCISLLTFRQLAWSTILPVLGDGQMSKFEEYRKNAEDARRQAARAATDEFRAAWLQLVQGWLALMPKQDPSRDKASTLRSKRKNRSARAADIAPP